MSEGVAGVLLLAAALGSGAVAGVYLAFSAFVMSALGRLPDAQGIAAMQAINVAAPSPGLAVPLVGTGALSIAVLVAGIAETGEPRVGWAIAGAVLHLASLAITMACNVPRNNALARLDPGDPEAAPAWSEYLTSWTRWNHARTAAALAGSAAMIVALGAL